MDGSSGSGVGRLTTTARRDPRQVDVQALDQQLAEGGWRMHVSASMDVTEWTTDPAEHGPVADQRNEALRSAGAGPAQTSPTAAEPQAGRVEVTAAGEDEGDHPAILRWIVQRCQ